VNPVPQKKVERLRLAPRCGAKTRAGTECQCPAIRGRRRCKLHGGRSPGAPRGANNGRFVDGFWSADAAAERRWARWLAATFGRAVTEK